MKIFDQDWWYMARKRRRGSGSEMFLSGIFFGERQQSKVAACFHFLLTLKAFLTYLLT